jgi:hypothetical protein
MIGLTTDKHQHDLLKLYLWKEIRSKNSQPDDTGGF